MTFERHYRVTALGTLPGGEIFNWGFALNQGAGTGGFLGDLAPNSTVWSDIRDDIDEFWQAFGVHENALLRRVKIADIGTDGRYQSAPVELEVNGSTGRVGTSLIGPLPNQVAMAMTLNTAADLGRVKGRFYMPLPGAMPSSDGLVTEAYRDAKESALQAFVNDINNQPGLDVLDIRVCVASQGRRNADGSQRLAPGNHVVTSVAVGRALDTIRRRRNKLTELHGTPSAVS